MPRRVSTNKVFIASSNNFDAVFRWSSSYRPVIAIVNGSTYGSRMELTLNCDIASQAGKPTLLFLS